MNLICKNSKWHVVAYSEVVNNIIEEKIVELENKISQKIKNCWYINDPNRCFFLWSVDESQLILHDYKILHDKGNINLRCKNKKEKPLYLKCERKQFKIPDPNGEGALVDATSENMDQFCTAGRCPTTKLKQLIWHIYMLVDHKLQDFMGDLSTVTFECKQGALLQNSITLTCKNALWMIDTIENIGDGELHKHLPTSCKLNFL
jgi:hypothetical protein